MTPVIVFGGGLAFSKGITNFTIASMFQSLTVIATITIPMANVMVNVPAYFGTLICVTRIQEFLLLADMPMPAKNETESSKKSSDAKGKRPQRRKRQVHLAVEFDNASITLPGKTEPLLRNIKLEVRQGQTAMIYGPVGCGKSSLLRAILGELETSGGFAEVDRTRMAYCDQTVWLQNHSIRDSIIAQNEYISARYAAVLYACVLREDIAQLPEGDATLVGTLGSALSGGQKQRVVGEQLNPHCREANTDMKNIRHWPGHCITMPSLSSSTMSSAHLMRRRQRQYSSDSSANAAFCANSSARW